MPLVSQHNYMVNSFAEDITNLAGGYSDRETNLNRRGNFLLTLFIVLAGTVDCRVRQDTRGLTQYCLLHYCPAKEEVSAGAAVVGVTNSILIGLEIHSIGRNFMPGTVVLVKSL